MKIPVKISRFLIIPIFLIKTKQEIFIKIDEEPIWSGLPGQFQPVFTHKQGKSVKISGKLLSVGRTKIIEMPTFHIIH